LNAGRIALNTARKGVAVQITVIGPTYPFRGGIAHYTTLLVRALRSAGHRVDFLSFRRQYPQLLFPGRTDRDPSRTVLQEPCCYLIDPLNPLTWRAAAARIRQQRPDLVVLQWWVPYWAPFLATLMRSIRRAGGPPVVVMVHNLVPHDGGSLLDRRLTRLALRGAAALCVHSSTDAAAAAAQFPDQPIVQLRMPAFLPLLAEPAATDCSMASQYGLPAEQQRIELLLFGFIRPYKGLAVLIEALAGCVQRERLHLRIAGEIWHDRSRIERLIRRHRLSGQVTLLNRYIPNEELPALFAGADALVLPYLSASQSAVVPLALAAGKPVVTTTVGGLPELVRDGIDGLLVAPGDRAALTAALDRLADRPTLAALQAAAAAQARQRQRDWPQIAAQLSALAQQLRRR
jgi:glycosyltransferase involved in cell wall biosynthesis